ncbi:hypothetical protein MJ904_11415 [Massilia sp. MB5]|uniref:hypothetical protein n=1 Tax=unclassified Massilia TaxID=2609279 RepID=UPI00067E50F0|nr:MULTISPECIES: hypothetical protein [unclassified Massilia]AKU22504.1 hypothetical protein ACZ75_14510 [Massilia sp. NR 4-1]UMR32711.1 hypothetical protein MJ904_11415 [Massilia sp. MB5]
MLKKIAFFVFALGLGTAYAASSQEYMLCLDDCGAAWENCSSNPTWLDPNACFNERQRCFWNCKQLYS